MKQSEKTVDWWPEDQSSFSYLASRLWRGGNTVKVSHSKVCFCLSGQMISLVSDIYGIRAFPLVASFL